MDERQMDDGIRAFCESLASACPDCGLPASHYDEQLRPGVACNNVWHGHQLAALKRRLYTPEPAPDDGSDLNEDSLAEAIAQIWSACDGLVVEKARHLIIPAEIVAYLGGAAATREIVRKITGLEVEDLPLNFDIAAITRDIARGG